jgi:hypothetical protein
MEHIVPPPPVQKTTLLEAEGLGTFVFKDIGLKGGCFVRHCDADGEGNDQGGELTAEESRSVASESRGDLMSNYVVRGSNGLIRSSLIHRSQFPKL